MSNGQGKGAHRVNSALIGRSWGFCKPRVPISQRDCPLTAARLVSCFPSVEEVVAHASHSDYQSQCVLARKIAVLELCSPSPVWVHSHELHLRPIACSTEHLVLRALRNVIEERSCRHVANRCIHRIPVCFCFGSPGARWVPFRAKEAMLLLEQGLNCAEGVQQAIGKGRRYWHSRILVQLPVEPQPSVRPRYSGGPLIGVLA